MTSPLLLSLAITIVIIVGVLFALRRSGMFRMSAAKREQAQQVIQYGQKARARLLRIDPTGMVVNNINIQCNLTFQLEPLSGAEPFQGSKRILIPQTQMPRVGDVWPAWYLAADPSTFVVGMPDGAATDQIPVFRAFGIPHPLDPDSRSSESVDHNDTHNDTVDALERLTRLHVSGALSDAEFAAAKAKLLEP